MPDKNVGWLLPATIRALRSWSTQPPDVLFSSGPPWSGHLVAAMLASVWDRPWVADFRDPWVRSPWTRYQTAPAFRIGAMLERWVVRRATSVVFTTETARQEFAAEYGPTLAAKFHAIPNGCDPREFADLPPRDAAPDAPFVILHAGSLYGGRSPNPVVRALALVCAKDPTLRSRVRLRFLGDTLDSTTLALCQEMGVDDLVEAAGRVSRRDSLAEMRRAGALLILQAGLNLAIPGKLYEYFAAGRPVLALCESGEMADVITHHGLGLVAQPDDEAAIGRAIECLVTGASAVVAAPLAVYDGRLRAAEVASLMEAACSPEVSSTRQDRVNEVHQL